MESTLATDSSSELEMCTLVALLFHSVPSSAPTPRKSVSEARLRYWYVQICLFFISDLLVGGVPTYLPRSQLIVSVLQTKKYSQLSVDA